MTDEIVQQRDAFVRFYRKVSPETYGAREASVSIPVALDGPDFEKRIDEAMQLAQVRVLTSVGVTFGFDEKTGDVVELPFAGAAPSAPQQSESRSSNGGASRPAAAPSGDAKTCPICEGGMYDNRSKNAERVAQGKKAGPDFKCKNYKDEAYSTDDSNSYNPGCTGVIWAPRN